ncbi:MAG: class I SAM-dependent methyltransferase [Bacteroidota bacterium]
MRILLCILALGWVSCQQGNPSQQEEGASKEGVEATAADHSHNDDSQAQAEDTRGSANHHMHQRSIEELVAQFDSPGRLAWQKPDTLLYYLDNFTREGLSGKSVAEIGAGSGYISYRLAKVAGKVIAVDVDQRFLDHIESVRGDWPEDISNRVETRFTGYDDPGLTQNEVDKVILVNTYHHIENRTDYLQKLKGVCKEIIVVDFKKGELPVGPPDEMKLSAQEILVEAYQAGITSARVDDKVFPYQYIIIMEI